RLVAYPECVLTTPDKPECRTAVAVRSTNSAHDRNVSGEISLPATGTTSTRGMTALSGSLLIAADADTSSGGGDFTATQLSPAGTWSAGGSSGDFSYNYPVAMPGVPGGAAPAVGLSYSSSMVD